MTAIARDLLSLADALPPWLVAVLIGWAVSFATTQPVKFAMPLSWDEQSRHVAAYLVAFASGALPAAMWMGDAGASAVATTMTALCSGLWAPAAFMLWQGGLRALSARWPAFGRLADWFSGDARGVTREAIARLKGE